MKINLSKIQLRELQNGLRSIKLRGSIPILNCALIHAKGDALLVTVTDLDNWLTFYAGQATEGFQAFTVPAEVFKKAALANLEIENQGATLAVRSQGMERILNQDKECLPEAFPQLPSAFPGKLIGLPPSIYGAIENAARLQSEEESRFVLCSVALQSGAVVGTNGKHLFAHELQTGLAKECILPSAAVKIFLKVFYGQTVTAQQDEKIARICFSAGNWNQVSKAVEANYPNWKQVIPDGKKHKLTVTLLDDQANNILKVLPKMPGKDLRDKTVILEAKHFRFYVTGKDESGEQTVDCGSVTGDKGEETIFRLGCNREFLSAALKAGFRTLQICDEVSALFFQDKNRHNIIMPVKLQ